MTDRLITRRELLKRAYAFGAAVAGVSVLSACGGEEAGGGLDCSAAEGQAQTMRTSLQYVEASTTADQNCINCNFFQGANATACGNSSLNLGNVNPNGWCSSWAAKQS